MKTGSGVVPLTVTVADLISNITIKGSSLINSANDILLSAYANIQATADASSNIPIPLSVAVMVLTSHVGLSVTDTIRLTAGKDITLEAVNNIDTKICQTEGKAGKAEGSMQSRQQSEHESSPGEVKLRHRRQILQFAHNKLIKRKPMPIMYPARKKMAMKETEAAKTARVFPLRIYLQSFQASKAPQSE